jgi:transcriptional regulator with XRE-family HTH domain
MEDNSSNLNASILTTPQWRRARELITLPHMAGELRPQRNIELGKRLALSRRALNLSQKAFAEQAGIKITTYNQYETGASYPPQEAVGKIREAHGLTSDWIYFADLDSLRGWLGKTIAALEAADAAREPAMKVVEPRRRRSA